MRRRHILLIIGTVCALATAHLLIQHNMVNNPFEVLAVLPLKFRNYLTNRRLQAPFRGSLKWRRLMYGSNIGDKYVWEAPLECKGGPNPELPDQYTVYLHSGYKLSRHKVTLQGLVDLDQVIDPEARLISGGNLFELYYSAHLNETALAAVRADLGVDWVACAVMVRLDDGWDSIHQLTDQEEKQLAEYADCPDRLDKIAAGADAIEGEKETLVQLCGHMLSQDWQEVHEA